MKPTSFEVESISALISSDAPFPTVIFSCLILKFFPANKEFTSNPEGY